MVIMACRHIPTMTKSKMIMMTMMMMRDNDENKVEREWQRTCDRRRQLVFCSPVTHCQNVTTVDLYYIHLTCISLQFSLLYFSATFLYFTSSVPCRTLSKWLRPLIIALHCTVMNRLSQCHIFTLSQCHIFTLSQCHALVAVPNNHILQFQQAVPLFPLNNKTI